MPKESKQDGLIALAIKALARFAGVPLAEDGPGAWQRTALPPSGAPPEAEEPEEGLAAAEAAFAQWKELDPFPQIAPALLNAADIDDYMRTVAMVFPYDPERRKTAAYSLRVGAEVAFWDPKRPKTSPIRRLNEGAKVIIPSNSLIYVSTRERFQLPNYMAVRFNLHIDLVHKGLLLGTGPMVDPGFHGRLMVPLHNLTSNDYVLAVGEDFIWAEFTKTSAAETWTQEFKDRPSRSGELIPFPEYKTNQSIAAYVEKAQRGNKQLQPGMSYAALQNAIPDAISRARKRSDDAKASATKAKKYIRRMGWIALLGATVAITSIFISSISAYNSTQGLVNGAYKELEDQADRIRTLEAAVNRLSAAPPTAAPAPPVPARGEQAQRRGARRRPND